MNEVDETTWNTLKRFRYDPEILEMIRARLGNSGTATNQTALSGPLEIPSDADLHPLPSKESEEGKSLASEGLAAIRAGHVGVIVLAGGMATRFGGVVKAAVEVVPGYSFLRVKLADIQNVSTLTGSSILVFLMTSFATSDEIRRLMREVIHPHCPIEIVEQSVTMRLTSAGQVFHDALGRPSLCATGHGDLLPSMRISGALGRFREKGGRVLLVSNVDNLAARLDPRVIGAHLRSGKAVTVEVVRKESGDRGGIPARVGGQLQIVEEFRFPPGFDAAQVPYFNTNTFVFNADALDREFSLEWFTVRRKIDGREAIQAERLLGQVTAFLPTQFVTVERRGPEGRFLPAKDREEMQLRMPEIYAIIRDLGIPIPPLRR
jgi:UTP--glucose-1-phosphate uridylyltransferase